MRVSSPPRLKSGSGVPGHEGRQRICFLCAHCLVPSHNVCNKGHHDCRIEGARLAVGVVVGSRAPVSPRTADLSVDLVPFLSPPGRLRPCPVASTSSLRTLYWPYYLPTQGGFPFSC